MTGGGKSPKIAEPQKVEEIQTVTETATEEQKRTRNRMIQKYGAESTFGYGISQALKKRLG